MDDFSLLDLATHHDDDLALLDLLDYRCAKGSGYKSAAAGKTAYHRRDELGLLQGLAGLGSHQELVFLKDEYDDESSEWERFWDRQEDRLSSDRSLWSAEGEDSAIDGDEEESPQDPQAGEDLDLPDPERPGIRPQDFGFIPPAMIPSSARVAATRTETVTVYLGRWQRPYNMTRPNPDYRGVPRPIMLPGSPDKQRVRHPSVSEFVRGPQRRDFVEECVAARAVDGNLSNINFPDTDYRRLDRETRRSPPRPPNLRRARTGNHLSDSDISLLSLGSPLDSLSPSDPLRVSSSLSSSSSSRGIRQHHRRSSSRRYGRYLDGIRAPVILSVDAPLGNDTSWSEPASPRSHRSHRSTASSLGGVFALDEEL